ncbi:hypothetical protein ACI65C_009493 [Semiaphis heraclei]
MLIVRATSSSRASQEDCALCPCSGPPVQLAKFLRCNVCSSESRRHRDLSTDRHDVAYNILLLYVLRVLRIYSVRVQRSTSMAAVIAMRRPLFWSGYLLLALTAAVAVTVAAPLAEPAAPNNADDVVTYDQRQNGTENVRISLSDLKVVLAPADGLFQIMSMAGAQFLNSELAGAASENRPTGAECTGFKCNNRHRQAAKKNRFKLSSLIAPLLNSQAEQKIAETENISINNNNTN